MFTFVMSSCADKERTSYCNFEFEGTVTLDIELEKEILQWIQD